MKINTIRGKNLASLEGEFEIDFTKEPLLSAGIFAITGPTGSGKSTLLDALCLALFAKTPRQHQAKESGIELRDGLSGKISQGDSRTILRKGAADGFAEVVFVGLDGYLHQSTWSVRRARNRADGSMQDYTLQLRNLYDGKIFPEKKTETLREIERLIGLNFEQFSRSVLLAQGDFTAFLKAGKDEKSALLEKLTGTDIYSRISQNIFEKTKNAEFQVKEIENQLNGIELLTIEEINFQQNRKVELESLLKSLEEQKEMLRKEMEWHSTAEKLAANISDAREILLTAVNKKSDAERRIELFNWVEKVQESRAVVEARLAALKSLYEKKDEKEKVGCDIEVLVKNLEVQSEINNQAVLTLNNAEKNWHELQPSLDEAKKLDTQIASLTGLVNEAAELVQKLLKSKADQEIINLAKDQERLVLVQKISVLGNWINEYMPKKTVAENVTYIISKLDDAYKSAGKQKELTEKQIAVNDSMVDLGKRKDELTSQILSKNLQFSDLQLKLSEIQKELDAFPIAEIEMKESESNRWLQILVPAKSCWDNLNDYQLKHEKAAIDYEKCLNSLVQTELDLKKGKIDLREAQIRKEQTELLLKKSQLSVAENVEALRSQLVDNEPCVVCGSLQHPYAASDQNFHAALTEISLQANLCNQKYIELLQYNSGLEQQNRNLHQEKERLGNELTEMNRKSSVYTHEWNTFELDEAILMASGSDKASVIEQKIASCKSSLAGFRNQISQYQQIRKDFDNEKVAEEKLKDNLAEIGKRLAEQTGEINLCDQQLVQITGDLSSNSAVYNELLAGLNVFLAQPGWQEKWLQNHPVFIQKLKSFSIEWNSKIALLDEKTKKQENLLTEIQGIDSQVELFAKQVNEAKNNYERLAIDLQTKLKQRLILFEGNPIDEVVERYAISKEKMARAVSESSDILAALQSETNLAKGRLVQIHDDLIAITRKVDFHSFELTEWLKNFNESNNSTLTASELNDLLVYEPAWVAAERKAIRNFDDAILAAHTAFKAHETQLENHLLEKISESDKDSIIQQLEVVSESKEMQLLAKNEIEFKLKQNATNSENAGKLLIEADSRKNVLDRWQKLNELLGSADGKKFRQIAQEYTLEVLLGYANIHLDELSGRYLLEVIPDTLGLQVVDRDMGEEIRSVHSLSGGESFLVSLALALGLASLSSNRMKVESLFIDEGFGSLDPQTLSVAMDALERLHNQGRKVGVISHVQEMTERITTQVRVTKLANGRSKIEVGGLRHYE